MNRHGPEAERGEHEPISIFFGAVHSYASDENLRYVILDVGEGSWFTASQVLGGGRLGFPGTGSRSDIKAIVDKMSYDEVLAGLKMTLEDTKSVEPTLRLYARKRPRILK